MRRFLLIFILSSLVSNFGFSQSHAQSRGPTSVHVTVFSALSWCIPCQQLHRILEQIHHRLQLESNGQTINVTFETVDVSNDQTLRSRRGFRMRGSLLPEIQITVGNQTIGMAQGSFEGVQSLGNHILATLQRASIFQREDPLRDIQPLRFTTAPPERSSAALLLGTGRNTVENPIFSGVALRRISRALPETSFDMPAASIATLHGSDVVRVAQSTNRPIDQSTNRPIDQSTNRPIKTSPVHLGNMNL